MPRVLFLGDKTGAEVLFRSLCRSRPKKLQTPVVAKAWSRVEETPNDKEKAEFDALIGVVRYVLEQRPHTVPDFILKAEVAS